MTLQEAIAWCQANQATVTFKQNWTTVETKRFKTGGGLDFLKMIESIISIEEEEERKAREMPKMFEEKIAKGVTYLDEDLGPSWPERIDLDKFDMPCGRRGIMGQLYGPFTDRFGCEKGVPYGFELYLTDDGRKYKRLKQEWKDKIAQLKVERTK